MIPVTSPFAPPLEEYTEMLEGIWSRNWMTNNGPLLRSLEERLSEYLGVKNLLFLANGTVAIQLAIKALDLKGEIITTPFSYVATTSSIVWENCTPVFADIDPGSYNIDPSGLESKITEKTCAILATHVFGNSCDVEKLENIAHKHSLKLVYDAAHCFGTEVDGKSVLKYGDVSTISFHATKLFHTVEGGAVVCADDKVYKRMTHLRNFGHDGPFRFDGIGINGKNSEFHAAMGLCNLKYIDEIRAVRKKQYAIYLEALSGLNLSFQNLHSGQDYNCAYFPVVFESEEMLLFVLKNLSENDVFPRRYFYPSLNTLDYVDGEGCPIAESIASRILCLPLYHTLTPADQYFVVNLIKESVLS